MSEITVTLCVRQRDGSLVRLADLPDDERLMIRQRLNRGLAPLAYAAAERRYLAQQDSRTG